MLALLILISLPVSSEEYRGVKQTKLPSGKIINVIAPMIKMHFPDGTKALRLRYITHVNLKNKKKLKIEADDIWSMFKYNVEKMGYKIAIMAAYEPWKGNFKNAHHSGFMFRLEKQNDGQWEYLTKIR